MKKLEELKEMAKEKKLFVDNEISKDLNYLAIESLTGAKLMEHCTAQNCETDYNGNILFYADVEELFGIEGVEPIKCGVYSDEDLEDYLYNNIFNEDDKKNYDDILKAIEKAKDEDDYELKEELEHEKNEFFTKFDFTDWETPENKKLYEMFCDAAEELKEELLEELKENL